MHLIFAGITFKGIHPFAFSVKEVMLGVFGLFIYDPSSLLCMFFVFCFFFIQLFTFLHLLHIIATTIHVLVI